MVHIMENQFATFLAGADWIAFGVAPLTPPWNLYLFIISHNVSAGGSTQKRYPCETTL